MKYALVTGSTGGMGYAIAEKFSVNGYYVFLNGRSDNPKIALSKDAYTYIKADLSSLDGMTTLADSVLRITQSIDSVVLNVGATCRKSLDVIEYSDWQHVFDTNVNVPFFLIQKLFNNIADNGTVTFISSTMSLKPHATSIPYGTSKAAVNMLAQNLVKEFAPRGIRVNVVCPGFVDTAWQISKTPDHRASITKKIALDRFASPAEVADVCLCVAQNGYINGAVIPVDGGYDFV